MSGSDYKVSVYSSKLGIPLNFVVHTHIVTEHAGMKNRYDVFMPVTLPRVAEPYSGNIFKNLLPPEAGFLLFFRMNYWWNTNHIKRRWSTTVASSISGNPDSAAHKLFQFVENGGLKSYPEKDRYRFILGPNSNFFTQWVIDQVPECELTLPWNAWGKGYKQK